MIGVCQGWEVPQDPPDTQDRWESQVVTGLLVKMDLTGCQGTMACLVKRVKRVATGRGGLRGREVVRDPQVEVGTTPRTPSP